MANRPTLNGKPVALKGDKTSTGGVILEGLDNHTVHGTPVAREGDKVWCPACKQTGTITTGAGMAGTKVNGIPFAVHGSAVTCGCSNHTVISPGQASKTTLASSAVKEGEPEQHAQASKKPKSGVDAITLVIGVFFDGTGNNAENTRNRLENCSAADEGFSDEEAISIAKQCRADEFGKPGDFGRTSYDGYFSNVSYLHELYDVSPQPNGDTQLGIYVPGIGTRNSQGDNKIGMAIGLLETGVVGNTDFAIDLISAALKVFFNENPSAVINEIKFDIFGFSRGAAAARHFANRVFKHDQDIKKMFSAILNENNYKGSTALPIDKCRFLGLFDTVAAIGTISDGFSPHDNKNGSVDLYLPIGIADKVFQISAMHECRYNFSLNSIKPSYPEISLPGVHSDIGGGYNPLEESNVFLTRPEFTTEDIDRDVKDSKSFKKSSEALLELEKYAAIYPLTIDNDIEIHSWQDQLVPENQRGRKKRMGSAITLKREVKNSLSNISLHVMLDAAKDAGACFVSAASPRFSVPENLTTCLEKAMMLSKAARYGGKATEFTQSEINAIAKEYVHCSANWNAVIVNKSGEIIHAVKASELIGFVNRPCDNWKRAIYDINGNLQ